MPQPGCTGPHDLGGDEQLLEQPVDLQEHDYKLWERQVHALQLELVRQRLLTVDEMRRAIEALPADKQQNLSYYEKWAAALSTICVERGTLTQQELQTQLGPPPTQATTARFHAGDVVRVKEESAAVNALIRKPHLRTPGYIHGLVGCVERECQGLFGDPEALAFRDTAAPKQPMYRVRFRQQDVWEGYAGGAQDTVDVEVYEPWLEPATQQELAAQHEASRQRHSVFAASHPGHGHPGHEPHHHHTHHHHHHTHHHHHHGDEQGPEEPHVHEARGEVEAAAVHKEGDEDAERRRLPEALIRACIAKGVVTAEALRQGVEVMDARGKSGAGARLVARAWLDPGFKERLLKDAGAAATELGINASVYPSTPAAAAAAAPSLPAVDPTAPCPLPVRSGTILTVVENTPEVHNLVVCTLCSCYPLSILGMSPCWYKSRAYRARAVRDPRGVLREFGTVLPDGVGVAVHDSTADNRYLVLPMRPPGTEEWNEEQLQAIITRDTMIGVAVPVVPVSCLISPPVLITTTV